MQGHYFTECAVFRPKNFKQYKLNVHSLNYFSSKLVPVFADFDPILFIYLCSVNDSFLYK